MTKENPKNVEASVRQRLLNVAQTTGEDYQALLTRFALERLLYRLGVSPHRNLLILKGAFLFLAWGEAASRPTKDLDFLASGIPEVERFEDLIADVCAIDDPNDGLKYHADSIRGEPIREHAIHDGIRLRLLANLGTARITLQIDIGFGDAAHSKPVDIRYPSVLNLPAPNIRAYRVEAVIAEKLEALVSIGATTSRLKDFFDIWHLASLFVFDGSELQQAVKATFKRRQTPIPADTPSALREDFASDPDRVKQWGRLTRRFAGDDSTPPLTEVCVAILTFVSPILSRCRDGEPFEGNWPPGGPWTHE